MLLDKYFNDVYFPLALGNRRPRTIELYAVVLRDFKRFLGRRPLLADLNDLTVARYLGWLRSRDKAPNTVDQRRDKLLALWRYAAKRGDVKKWPTLPPELVPEREPEAWLEHEMQRLFDAAGRAEGFVGKFTASCWWPALLLVLWDTSERIGAVMSIEWKHVDLDTGWLLIMAEDRKGGRRDRRYRLSAETCEALRLILQPDGKVFLWPRDMTLIYDDYRKILVAAGLPTDRNCMFHRVRRTVASYYEAGGGNATELLGHTSRKVTEAYLDKRVVGVPDPTKVVFRLRKSGA